MRIGWFGVAGDVPSESGQPRLSVCDVEGKVINRRIASFVAPEPRLPLLGVCVTWDSGGRGFGRRPPPGSVVLPIGGVDEPARGSPARVVASDPGSRAGRSPGGSGLTVSAVCDVWRSDRGLRADLGGTWGRQSSPVLLPQSRRPPGARPIAALAPRLPHPGSASATRCEIALRRRRLGHRSRRGDSLASPRARRRSRRWSISVWRSVVLP